jgi:hypothetical protein
MCAPRPPHFEQRSRALGIGAGGTCEAEGEIQYFERFRAVAGAHEQNRGAVAVAAMIYLAVM